ncbi:MAG TPA: sugar dehydrogenase, partial [Micromonosporaceae bacterium]|nr:sugar dehydrogenase [Micromonosporaceae bacterium]
LPSGFQEQIVFSGLVHPTNMEFAADGRVFVAEKRGTIMVFDNLADTTPTLFADLSAKVNNIWDRGLLGLALHPEFPAQPWVYVLYTYDAPPGQTAPYWNDDCPASIGGGTGGNCIVTARLSRLRADGNVMTGAEQVLIGNEWCQQFPSHSIGDLRFGADGMLYVSAGDGASFSAVDHGQYGSPANPCNDPVNEGGALRSQDVRTDTDGSSLNGAVLRLDPATGFAAPGNPYLSSPDLNKRRVVGLGLRNPYRFTIRPGTSEPWLGDVGWNGWEEIERIADPLAANPPNFGWPCYEGAGPMTSYDQFDLPLCESLYPAGGEDQTPPYFTYRHDAAVVPGENCARGGNSIGGLAFHPAASGSYPADYRGALFFADYSRGCIWVMKPQSPGGLPAPGTIEVFAEQATAPVDLATGPGGDLYYLDLGGTVRRFRYFPGNQPPVAAINASPEEGQAPLAVQFDASASTDSDPADAGRLTYDWDFTNDGSFDANGVTAQFTYPSGAVFTARLRVTDTLGAWDEQTIPIYVTGFLVNPVIDAPTAGLAWAVGDIVTFSGRGIDPEEGPVDSSALSWQLRMRHCETPSDCHTHVIRDWPGVASGSFQAPDHDFPSYLELALTARDPDGREATLVRRLDPKTVTVNFTTKPEGLQLTVGPFTGVTPFATEVIQGSTQTISVAETQQAGSTRYAFFKWSDYGPPAHVVTVNESGSYKATYFPCGGWYRFLRPRPCAPPPPPAVRRHTPY